MAGVDALPALVGREQADPDVDPAVAHGEDPAVAGHHVALGVADVEVRLNEGVVVALRAVVAPQGHPHRQVAPSRRAEHPPDARVGPVGHHHIARLDGPGAAAALLLHRDAGQRGQGPGARRGVLDDRPHHLGALQERRPGRGGVAGHDPVEVVAGDGVAVGGEVGVLGPLHLHGEAEPVGPQPGEAVRAGQGVLESHVGQLAHRPRRQPVAARLLPRELLLLHHHDVPAGVGQPVAARGPGGPGAHHHHVVHPLRRAPRLGRGRRCVGRRGCRGRCLRGRRLRGCRLLGR